MSRTETPVFQQAGSRRRDRLVRFLIVNGLWGAGLGVSFAVGVVALNLGRLRDLITLSPDGVLAFALLCIGSIVTFSSVVMGGAVMLMDHDDAGRGSGRRVRATLVPQPVAVTARRSRRA